MSDFIELLDVSKSYREGLERHYVLERVSGCFSRGEIVVLLGRSGSGKSTLLNLLAGIDLPDAGEVRVDGRTINHLSERDRTLFRRRVGFVFQFFNLVPTLTARENVALPLMIKGRCGADEERAVDEALALVGMARRADHHPFQLSGGEMQLVSIARALVHEPKLLILDEPTAGVDIEMRRSMWDFLRSINDDGTTIILTTHYLEEAEQLDRKSTRLNSSHSQQSRMPSSA